MTKVAVKIISVCALMLLVTVSVSSAKEWRGIVPLHSTCEDVKRILSVSICDSPHDIEDGRVFITFSKKPCADGWDVPPGTVLSVTFYPKTKPLITELGVDIGKYKREELPYPSNYTFYSNSEEGTIITTTPDQKVDSINYYAAAKDGYLRYPNSLTRQPEISGNPHGVRKFDEYGGIIINEERKRLNDFARELQSEPNTQGFIIAYAGRRSRAGEAQARVERAKNYLVNTHNIESARIVTVDGGYREELAVELFVGAKGGAAPIPSPTVCPSEVQIIKAGNARNNNRRSTRLHYRR
jgi:hypothetical protein